MSKKSLKFYIRNSIGEKFSKLDIEEMFKEDFEQIKGIKNILDSLEIQTLVITLEDDFR